MAESHVATLEALTSQSLGPRRPRPPNLDIPHGGDGRVPLRVEEKMRRRESRLGLRSIFGRQKSVSDLLTADAPPTRESPSRSGGIRASLADISNWPYALHHARSEIALSTTIETPDPVSTGVPSSGPAMTPVKSATSSVSAKQKSSPHTHAPAPRSSRGALATWDPPPLFQAYPQAIRHVELPACTLSAEAILRMHGGKGNVPVGENQQDKATDKVRKRHRRNTSGSSFKAYWTTKIYVLVTSGYLLQYAGEGSFDRLPEKILQLGKDSAAFASDLIPGRHWVVQVSAAMDADGAATVDNRSLFSRLPFRGAEKRQASLFLMVFESAEEMDQWLAIMRREIEHLGGKKSLSETGRPKADEEFQQLNSQPSQRTLVVRDPERFSRIISGADLTWEPPELGRSRPDIHLESTSSIDSTPDQSFDDVSTTNSIISHDGRQLDSLRDNRFSFVSSGHRTIPTPEGSSPACSPVRDSFSSYPEELPFQDALPPPTSHPSPFYAQEAQPRPNAQAILDRRLSMRTMNPLIDVRVSVTAPPRPLSTYQTSQTTPNFSVPHAVSKRYSLVKSASVPLDVGGSPSTPAQLAATPRSFSRGPPPPSHGSSRPLSIVADHPSPVSSPMSSPASPPPAHCDSGEWRDDDESPRPGHEQPAAPSISISPDQESAEADPRPNPDLSSGRRSSVQLTVPSSPPRRHASLQTLRPQRFVLSAPEQNESSPPQQEASRFESTHLSVSGSRPDRYSEPFQRSKSSLGSYERDWQRPRSPSLDDTTPDKSRRSSMFVQSSAKAAGAFRRCSTEVSRDDPTPLSFLALGEPPARRHGVLQPPPSSAAPSFIALGERDPQRHVMLPPPDSPPPSTLEAPIRSARSSISSQHLRIVSDPKMLPNRRSMPQLAEGPPPAPPPTCALPPIPPRAPGPTRAARSQSNCIRV